MLLPLPRHIFITPTSSFLLRQDLRLFLPVQAYVNPPHEKTDEDLGREKRQNADLSRDIIRSIFWQKRLGAYSDFRG
jgi:hypothetical protein